MPTSDRTSSKRLTNAIALLAIGSVVIIGYKLSPMVRVPVETRATPDQKCNLNRGTCSVSIAGGHIEVSINPRPVPLIKPVRIEVRTTGFEPVRIDADFAGIGMNMGFNRPQLLQQQPGTFVGETTLPVCITGTMQWELTLLIATSSGHFVIPIRFDTPDGGNR